MAKLIPMLSIDTTSPPVAGKFVFKGVFIPAHVVGVRDHLFAVLYDTGDLTNFQASAVAVDNNLWTVTFPLVAGKTYAFMVYTGKVRQPGPNATWSFKV